jgi:hypothetical protein
MALSVSNETGGLGRLSSRSFARAAARSASARLSSALVGDIAGEREFEKVEIIDGRLVTLQVAKRQVA